MKKFFVIFSLVLACLLPVRAQQTMWVHTGQVKWAFTTSQLGQMPIADASTVTILDKSFAISEIDSITVDTSEWPNNNIAVTYNGDKAQVIVAGNIAKNIPLATVTGANVAIIQDEEAVAEEYTYTLSGSSNNGSFWMDGKYKMTLVLDNLTLTSADSAAVNIRNGKRIAVTLVGNNTLSDGATGTQKGCFAVKGHPEITGSGNLTLTGNASHALWTGEYLQLKKKFTGTITVTAAAGDGFNINQYFQQNGGNVIIKNVADDGVQVSVTDDEADEYNGEIMINGGSLNVTVSGEATKGLKADSNVTIAGGTIEVNSSAPGTWDATDNDAKASACIKSDAHVTIGGDDTNITLKATGTGGKGINADSTVVVNGGTFIINATGKQYTYTSGSTTYTSSPNGIKAGTDITIAGGDITVTCTQDEAEGIESEGTLHVSGGTIVANCYDNGIKSEGDMTITGGNITSTVTGTASKGIKCDGNLLVDDGTIKSTTSGGGMWDSADNETKACAALKVKGTMTTNGGTFNLSSSGQGGKGISADGAVTFNDGDFTIKTTGTRYTYGSTGGGGWGPGSSSSSSNKRSSPKGIKCDGALVFNGGTFNVSATGSGDGAECIESKSTITINDGTIECTGYDDCINSSKDMTIAGGKVYVNATKNDGLDSNGNLIIKGGVVVAYGSTSPECGLDAIDGEGGVAGYLYITGGYVLAVGGGTSNPHNPNTSMGIGTAQPTMIYSGTQTANTNYALSSTGGNVMAYTMTKTYSTSGGGGGWGPGGGGNGRLTVVMSAPGLKSGTTYNFYSGSTLNTAKENWHGLYYNGDAVTSNGSSQGSKSATTPYFTIGSSY